MQESIRDSILALAFSPYVHSLRRVEELITFLMSLKAEDRPTAFMYYLACRVAVHYNGLDENMALRTEHPSFGKKEYTEAQKCIAALQEQGRVLREESSDMQELLKQACRDLAHVAPWGIAEQVALVEMTAPKMPIPIFIAEVVSGLGLRVPQQQDIEWSDLPDPRPFHPVLRRFELQDTTFTPFSAN